MWGISPRIISRSLSLDKEEEDAIIMDPILDSISEDSIDHFSLHAIDDNEQ